MPRMVFMKFMNAAPEQNDTVTEQDWKHVQELIAELKQDEACEDFLKALFQWDLVVKSFRKTADRRLLFSTPTEVDLQFHAMSINALLALGNALLLQAKQFSPEELAKHRVKHSEIEAYVEDLAQRHREWHHGFTADEVSALRRKIFSHAS
jgi:hypothetical protein